MTTVTVHPFSKTPSVECMAIQNLKILVTFVTVEVSKSLRCEGHYVLKLLAPRASVLMRNSYTSNRTHPFATP